jgi:hypothetical protein
VGGYAGGTPLLARIITSGGLIGLLDRSFGVDGVAIPPQIYGAVEALAIDQSGRIIAAGATQDGKLLVFRLTHKGALDRTFGTGGKKVLNFSRADAFAAAVKIQKDGRILVSGGLTTYGDPGIQYLLMTRYTGGNACVVPAVRGKTLAGARWALRRRHCTIGRVSRVPSQQVGRGRIIRQHPGWGRRLPARSKVNLVVSKGKRR